VVAAVSAAAILLAITIVPMWAGQETSWEVPGGLADQMVFRRYTIFRAGLFDTGKSGFLFSHDGGICFSR